MAATQNVALVLACILWCGQAGRVAISNHIQADDQELQAGNRTSSSPLSQWAFSIKKTLCSKIDFGSLNGILAAYPNEVHRMRSDGLKLADEYNCRLCDISGSHGDMSNAKVECHAKEGWVSSNTAESCLDGNGKPGFRKDQDICLPCPEQCAYCEKPGATDLGYMFWKWFKCVLPKPKEGALPAPVSGPWNCENVTLRSKKSGYKQWCNYRTDLLSTSSNGFVPVKTSTWGMKITAARCDMPDASGEAPAAPPEMESGPSAASTPFPSFSASADLEGIVQAIAPKFISFFQRNCQFCRVEAGGLVGSHTSKFTVGKSGSSPWADAFCAYDELGYPACRTDRGPVGWSSKHDGCMPCPLECSSCVDESTVFSRKFSCKLRPTIGAVPQLNHLLSGTAEIDGEPPMSPEGFDCGKPEKRKCTRGTGMCMGYKVSCKYQLWED